jgi:hypothetical protein
MVRFKKLLSFLVFPFQRSKWISYFIEYLPFCDDAQILYFSMYGERCCVYSTDHTFLNKCLLNDLKSHYRGFIYLSHFINSAYQSDVSMPNYQQMQFLIMLKPKLFVEFDSIRYYRIYYGQEYEDTELQEVLKIFRKNQKIDWPRNLHHIKLN